MYSRQFDKEKDISIRSSCGIEYEKHKIEKINQGKKLEGYQSIQIDQAAKNIMIKEDKVFKLEHRSKIKKYSCISNQFISLLLSNNCSSVSNLLTELA